MTDSKVGDNAHTANLAQKGGTIGRRAVLIGGSAAVGAAVTAAVLAGNAESPVHVDTANQTLTFGQLPPAEVAQLQKDVATMQPAQMRQVLTELAKNTDPKVFRALQQEAANAKTAGKSSPSL